MLLRNTAIQKFCKTMFILVKKIRLTLSYRRSISYRNQSIGLLCKSIDWFLCDTDLIKTLEQSPWTLTVITPVKVKIGNFTSELITLSVFQCYGIMIIFYEGVVRKFMKIYVNFVHVC